MTHYAITLTTSGGFTPDHVTAIRLYFKSNCEKCLVVTELTSSGFVHLHAGAVFAAKNTGGVTRRFQVLYKNTLKLEVTPNSITVKKTSCEVGWWWYLLKDLDGPPLYISGWKLTWIQEQCKANVKLIPDKVLKKNSHTLNMSCAAERMLEYASASGMQLGCKEAFKQVYCAMEAEGYKFHLCKIKHLYCQVMSKSGDRRAAMSHLDMLLEGLD